MNQSTRTRRLLLRCVIAATFVGLLHNKAWAMEEAQKLETPNGHEFWYLPMPEAERNAISVTWHTDLPQDEKVHPSTARVGIELMLNGGAGGKEPTEIIADFEDLDSGSRLWVQPREISGFIVAPEEHMEKAAEIANTVLTEPNFDQKWFERERGNFAENATMRDSHIWGLAWNKQFWSLRPAESVAAVKLDDIKDWHKQSFTTKALTISAAGNASSEKMATQIDRVLEGMPDNEPANFIDPPKPTLHGKTILLHQPEAEKSAMLLIGELPTKTSENELPMQLGIGVLGHGKQSRLFKAIRTGLRASYGFGAGRFDYTRKIGILQMSGEVETEKLQQALDIIEETYKEFREDGIGRVEFPIAKKFYEREITKELKEPTSVAHLLKDAQLSDQETDHVATLLDQIGSMDRTAVNNVIRENLPEFGNILKIIVTADEKAIDAACVITSIDAWQSCM